MKNLLLFIILLFPLTVTAQTGAVQGYCDLGGKNAIVSGMNSSNYMQGIIPHCTVTVYLTGTTTKATLFSNAIGTPLTNPFKATVIGQTKAGSWIFWAATNAGLDITLSGGDAPNTYPSPVTITDVFPSQSFSPISGVTSINTVQGGFTFTGPDVNCVSTTCTFSNTAGATLQTNSVSNTSQSLLNFTDTATVKFTNPSGGVESASVPSATNSALGVAQCDGTTTACTSGVISAIAGSTLQMAVNGSPATQYVIVRPSSGSGSCPSGTTCDVGASSAYLTWYCTGVLCNVQPHTLANWVFTGSVLPPGVSAGSVTAVYAYSINSALSTSTPISSTLTCNSQNIKAGTFTWSQRQGTSGALSGITGSNFTGVTCAADLIPGGAPGPSGLTMNVPDIGLIIAYTGTPATTPPVTLVATPLYYNPVLSQL